MNEDQNRVDRLDVPDVTQGRLGGAVGDFLLSTLLDPLAMSGAKLFGPAVARGVRRAHQHVQDLVPSLGPASEPVPLPARWNQVMQQTQNALQTPPGTLSPKAQSVLDEIARQRQQAAAQIPVYGPEHLPRVVKESPTLGGYNPELARMAIPEVMGTGPTQSYNRINPEVYHLLRRLGLLDESGAIIGGMPPWAMLRDGQVLPDRAASAWQHFDDLLGSLPTRQSLPNQQILDDFIHRGVVPPGVDRYDLVLRNTRKFLDDTPAFRADRQARMDRMLQRLRAIMADVDQGGSGSS